jgi:hypothetical protein
MRSPQRRKVDGTDFLTASRWRRKAVWGRAQLGGVRDDMHERLSQWLEACQSSSGAAAVIWSRGARAGVEAVAA